MKLLLVLTFLFGIPEQIGVQVFGIQSEHFPCPRLHEIALPGENRPLSFVWKTFGTNNDCLNSYLELNPEAMIVVHMTNEVSRRKGNQCRGELLRGWNKDRLNRFLERNGRRVRRAYKRRIKEIDTYFKSTGFQGRVIISAGLEDNYSQKAAGTILRILKRTTDYETLRNPLGAIDPGRCHGRRCYDWIELHGYQVKFGGRKNIYSNDGIAIDYGQQRILNRRISPKELRRTLRQQRKSGNQPFVWFGEGQGLLQNSSRSPCPRKRRIRIPKRLVRVLRRIIK